MIHDKNIVEILLVDDDQDDRSIFSDALSELKIETNLNLLEDGRELVNYLEDRNNKRPDILFLDLNMPYKSGVECLKDIRQIEKFRDLSVAIYSTSNSEKDMEDTFINGANIYIRKPNDFTQLKKVLTEVLSINWQFHTSALNKETFLLNI
ncbi:response regulator [Flavobacterium sp.]|uniref:response regulator n=1 Tax=Flavobacterium sp. TaxID=239 RepID=UPI001212BFD6|nr:response regulator [Flavobacterium sp.]RZJ72146.1 MAG: response regulator [Flavobacterium sp.]